MTDTESFEPLLNTLLDQDPSLDIIEAKIGGPDVQSLRLIALAELKKLSEKENSLVNKLSGTTSKPPYWRAVNAALYLGFLLGQQPQTNLTNKLRMTGLDRKNYDRQFVQRIICLRAKSIWDEDRQEEIRIGVMCLEVFEWLHSDFKASMEDADTSFNPELLPKVPESIRRILKKGGVVPAYASKDGASPQKQ